MIIQGIRVETRSLMHARRKDARRILGRVALLAFVALLLASLAWTHWVLGQIQYWSTHNEAASSDAIAVFGAAEYDGRPSPVLRARLNHANQLYRHNLAPLIITLGGNGGDQYSEGGVGQSYLMGLGVPESDIIAETESTTTEESVAQLAIIARANHLQRIILVSDGDHLFRIRALCKAAGLNVLSSPRPPVSIIGDSQPTRRLIHEFLSYTAWRLHLR